MINHIFPSRHEILICALKYMIHVILGTVVKRIKLYKELIANVI